MSEVIGFVGLGQMGQPMALNLLRAGVELRVFDLREERLAPLVALGAQRAWQLAEIVEPGGIVLSMVPDDRALLQVTLSEGGILQSIGERGIHLSLSTVSPQVAVQLAHLYAHQESSFLAGTVLGRPELAEAAQLSLFLSGRSAAKARVLPLLEILGNKINDLGERVEEALVVKLGYNFLIAAAIEAMGEAAALVEHSGAERERFLHILVDTPLFAGAVYEGYGRRIGSRDYSDARFPVAMGLKDMALVLQEAERVGVPLPSARIVQEHLLAAQSGGRAHEDWSVLADFATRDVTANPLSA